MKIYASSVLSAVAAFVSSQILLQVQYPWSLYAAYNFSKDVTIASYLLVSVILALVAATSTVVFLRVIKGSILASALLCGAAAFLAAALMALLMGPGGIDVPGLRLNGIFFSEFEFLRFIFFVAAPVSLIAAALCGWLARKNSDPPAA